MTAVLPIAAAIIQGMLCMGADRHDRTEETALIQLKRGEAKIREQDYTKCLIAGYNKIG